MTALPVPEWGHDAPTAAGPIAPSALGMSVALSALSATDAAQLAGGPTAGVADLVDAIADLVPARLTVHQRESLETALIGAIDSRIVALRAR
ncbi:MAG TPA: hypothetical protein VGN18_15835 [Jatrophihabitans sp.]|jgi:hypothetical protein|uniref:hypothetical protein n=1 Tax=Jatrophihabitans sp. TaxID=1932789 RepID=UPI002DFBBF8B|nr:hypothetical protein [Jatrophihabitans sp.]